MLQSTQVVRAIHTATADIAAADAKVINVGGAKKISLIFKADVTSGNGVFTVDVGVKAPTESAITWVTGYAKLISNVANTNAQTLTRVASVTLSTDTTVMVSVSPEDAIQFLRVPLNMTTDGTYDCWVVIEY